LLQRYDDHATDGDAIGGAPTLRCCASYVGGGRRKKRPNRSRRKKRSGSTWVTHRKGHVVVSGGGGGASDPSEDVERSPIQNHFPLPSLHGSKVGPSNRSSRELEDSLLRRRCPSPPAPWRGSASASRTGQHGHGKAPANPTREPAAVGGEE
jgi:hypothetical protein